MAEAGAVKSGKERRLENLRPAKKGEVRNAKGINGVTKDRRLSDMMHADGDAMLPVDRMELWPEAWRRIWPFMTAIWPKTKTIREFVSHMAWLQGAQDADARNKLQDRLEGKVSLPVSNPDGSALNLA